jgi:hypothetical protein
MGSAGEGDLGEGDAEGELEDWGCGVFIGGEVEEGAFDFAAAFGEVLGDDEKVGLGVGG